MTKDEADIRALEDRRYAAMLAGDVATLTAMCSKELIYTHSQGDRDTFESYLAKVTSGHFVYHKIDHAIDHLILRGDAALVVGTMTAHVNAAGQDRHINNACLAVWLRESDGWKFAAYQPTPIPA